MHDILPRQIRSEIEMRDGSFGIWLNLREHLPKWATACSVVIRDEKDKIVKTLTLLPHQLYLKDLKEYVKNDKYDVIITPIVPQIKPFSIFINEKGSKTDD